MKKQLIAIIFLSLLGFTACGKEEPQIPETVETTIVEETVAESAVETQQSSVPAVMESEIETEESSVVEEDPNETQYLKDVDWEELESRITDEEAQALQKYMSVLQGGEFVWICTETADEIHNCYNTTIWKMMAQLLEECDMSPEEPIIYSILFSDMFQTGNKDVCIELGYLGINWLILHEEDGVVYGILLPVRWFNGVQEDGLYLGSGGAGTSYYHRMHFENGDYYVEDIATVDEGELFINDEKRPQEELEPWLEENTMNPVEIYRLHFK